ncbi:MAG: holo-ACP synthase [Clostridiales bacterium]|nr:holo-ACP synthase [Clostridiales bacterium]
MIIGIGVDIIEIERIEKAINKNEKFMIRIFSDRERSWFNSRQNNVFSIAANFAGKEAVSKVLGTGISNFKWTDIEIMRDDLGKPYVILSNGAKMIADAMGIKKILITLSHSKKDTVAYAIGTDEQEE